MNRREFLRLSCPTSTSYSGRLTVSAWAYATQPKMREAGKLIVVILRGGIDGLNVDDSTW